MEMKIFARVDARAPVVGGCPPQAPASRAIAAPSATTARMELRLMVSSQADSFPDGLRSSTSPDRSAASCAAHGIPSSLTDIRQHAVLSSRRVGEERAIARTAGGALPLLLFFF